MKITVEIPDAMESSLREQFGQDVSAALKVELAIALYQAERISIGQFAELLQISIYDAETLLKHRGVESTYSFDDFEHDRSVLKQLQLAKDDEDCAGSSGE